jgi:hypothetical protein
MRYTQGIKDEIFNIFSGVLFGGVKEDNPKLQEIVKEGKINLSRFRAKFRSNVFQDEYAIFYSLLVDKGYSVFTSVMLLDALRTSRDLVLDSPYVDLNRIIGTGAPGVIPNNDEKFAIVTEIMMESFEALSNNYVSEDDFDTSVMMFEEFYKDTFMLEVTQNMTLIQTEGGYAEKLPGHRSKLWKGRLDAYEYFEEKRKWIESLEDEVYDDSLVLDEEWAKKAIEGDSEEKDEPVFKIPIEEINSVVGMIRRTEMIEFMGPPKGGKTRACVFVTCECIRSGLNVTVWPLEGSSGEWINCIIACLVRMEYNISISSSLVADIRKSRKEKDNDEIEIEHGTDVSKVKKGGIRRLINNIIVKIGSEQSWGRLTFMSDIFYIEDCFERLTTHYKKYNPFDVIVVDSPILATSKKSGENRFDVASKAYKMLKLYVAKVMEKKSLNPAVAVVTGQYKQAEIDYLRKHPDEEPDVTAGAETAESIRTPDEIFGIFSNEAERKAGMIKFFHIATRHGAQFDSFYCAANYGCCYFSSDPSLNDSR